MAEDLKGRVVLITGGTSGIGLAAAASFLRQGAKVAINGRSLSRGRQALKELRPISEDVLLVQGDVSQYDDCERIVQEAVGAFAGLNVVVNSAGVYLEKMITDTTAAELLEVFGTNANGTYFISKYAVPERRKAGGGSIINISSDVGLRGNLLCSAYCAAKGAVVSFTPGIGS
jgi:NAD(P)-dependent dehydrogenase (short-subunit alcohol dehydrogenase family)